MHLPDDAPKPSDYNAIYFVCSRTIRIESGLWSLLTVTLDYHQRQCRSDNFHDHIDAWGRGCLNAFYVKASLHDLILYKNEHGSRHGKEHNNNPPIEHRHANIAVAKLSTILKNEPQYSKDAGFTAAIMFHIVHGAMAFAFAQQPIISKEQLFIKVRSILDLLFKSSILDLLFKKCGD